ncbi:unnamed protein product [Camellia sinensis]
MELSVAIAVAATFFFVLSLSSSSSSSSSSFLFLPLSRGLNHRRSRRVWRRNDLADSRECKMGERLDRVQKHHMHDNVLRKGINPCSRAQ